jgi:hypothetical protein
MQFSFCNIFISSEGKKIAKSCVFSCREREKRDGGRCKNLWRLKNVALVRILLGNSWRFKSFPFVLGSYLNLFISSATRLPKLSGDSQTQRNEMHVHGIGKRRKNIFKP